MEEGTVSENHLTSAAAFVEGGIQDACDDACSICLEAFSENDPSTVTGCKHEFHLQCILEWCQRSSQCPMCWQSISLKDPSSQELLDAIEQERSIRNSASRNATIFHHPTLGDFELQHLPVSATDAELEERIIQHLAAAAAMGRARHIARREGHRNRSSAQSRPQFLVFSAQSNVPSPIRASDSSGIVESAPASSAHNVTPSATVQEAPVQAIPPSISVQANEGPSSPSPSSVIPVSPQGTTSMNRRSTIQSSLNNEDRAGPSELHSFSESVKSRINAMSMRYKESITKSTRGWKERLFSRNTSTTTLVSEVPGQGNSDIATLSRLMDHLELRENSTNSASVSNNLGNGPSPDHGNQQTAETAANGSVNNSEIKATAAEPSTIG